MPTLYTRIAPFSRSARSLSSLHEGFVKTGEFKSYHEAVRNGQLTAGPGNFYVYTGEHVPSREEQLLLPPRNAPRRKREFTFDDDLVAQD